MDDAEHTQQLIMAELGRLGLDTARAPFGVLSEGADLRGLASVLAHLRTLDPGATWHDVFPDLPKHWLPGHPDTWTSPYLPRGPYDYQELPTGPAILVIQDTASEDWGWVTSLAAEARAAGWPVYGAGPAPSGTTVVPGYAYVVLERGTSEDVTWGVAQWVDSRAGLTLGGVSRTGAEEYLTEDGAP